jgi:hypothetical protein
MEIPARYRFGVSYVRFLVRGFQFPAGDGCSRSVGAAASQLRTQSRLPSGGHTVFAERTASEHFKAHAQLGCEPILFAKNGRAYARWACMPILRFGSHPGAGARPEKLSSASGRLDADGASCEPGPGSGHSGFVRGLSLFDATPAAKRVGINKLAPHDLRRSCARFCHLSGGELEQIQFLLGHASVQTTERYLGCKQKLRHAVNDNLGLEDS